MITDGLFRLDGKRALVTGSSKGIGLALAGGMAAAGAEVVLNARGEQRLQEAAGSLGESGARVHARAFDVTDHAGVKQAVEAIETEIGPIDVLVNNAGMQHRTPLEDFPAETYRQLMSTNVDSVFNVGQAVAGHMIGRGAGQIVNICSVQTALARPGIAPYVTSKGAVANMTKAMCTDWAPHGLRINGLAPGYFKTELNEALVANEEFSAWLCKRTPMGRWGEVEELIGACIFLCAPASSFVNGHILYVDGGITACL